MRRTLTAGLLAATAVAAGLSGGSWASAQVCTQHYAGTPYVAYVSGGNAVLDGGGQIGGCPIGSAVDITVALQHSEDGVWVDQASTRYVKAFSRYYRFARQAGGTVTAPCKVGDWRVQVTGTDGPWVGQTVTFQAGDSGVCGAYGGGD